MPLFSIIPPLHCSVYVTCSGETGNMRVACDIQLVLGLSTNQQCKILMVSDNQRDR